MYSPEDLSPIYREMFTRIKLGLPSQITERLRANRGASPHQSKTDMILFNIWDKFQTGLGRNQFNYCLNYKPLRPEANGHTWLLQLRCNIERIPLTYPGVRDQVRVVLQKLERVCPEPFVYRENTQTLELRYTFNFQKPLSKFNDFVVPKLMLLISASHAIYVEAVELFHIATPKAPLKVCAGFLPKPARVIQKELSVYSRTLPASMKAEILEKYKHRCQRCGKPIAKGDLEFHHIKSVRDGGLRLPENFAPLHVACHDEVHRLQGCEWGSP